MAALGKQFFKINNTDQPESSQFNISHQVVENIFQTEDGYDTGIVVRSNKHKFSVAWVAADDTHKGNCETYCSAPTVTLGSGTVITGGNGTQTNPYVVG